MATPVRPDGFQGSTLPLRQWYGSQFAAGYQPLGQEEAGVRTWDPDYGLNTFQQQGGNPNDLAAYHSWITDKHIPTQFGMSPKEWATKNYPLTAMGGYDPETDMFTTMFEDEHHGVAQNFQGPLTIAAMALGAGALSGLGAGAGAAAGEGAALGAAGAAEGTGLASIWGNALPFGSAELGIAGTGAAASGGGGVFDPLADFGADYFAGAGDYTGGAAFDPTADFGADYFDGAWRELSTQAPPTNLQDKITAFDSLYKAGNSVSKIGQLLGLSDSDVTTLGKLAAAGLGAIGSSQQANSLQSLADKYAGYGAPSRARYEASMTPGFDPTSIPGYSGALDTASKSVLAKLAATGGNPYGNPGALIEANKAIINGTALPAINEYQRTNANAGGLANMNAAVPNLEASAIGKEGGIWDSIGYGLNALTQPKQMTLADIAKAFNMTGLA